MMRKREGISALVPWKLKMQGRNYANNIVPKKKGSGGGGVEIERRGKVDCWWGELKCEKAREVHGVRCGVLFCDASSDTARNIHEYTQLG